MSSEINSQRGYQIIEPSIYEQLNWDMDIIVYCLEFIRNQLPIILDDFPTRFEYDLISYGNPLGNSYPVIGIYSNNRKDYSEKLSDYFTLNDKVNKWIEEYGINELMIKSKEFSYVSWEILKDVKTYPIRI